jgi:hypothetical protein
MFTGSFFGNSDDPFFQSDQFNKILTLLQKYHPKVELKLHNNKPQLIIKNITHVQQAIDWLLKMENY